MKWIRKTMEKFIKASDKDEVDELKRWYEEKKMTIRSIPPSGSIPPRQQRTVKRYNWKGKKYKPSPKSTKGLEQLLKHGLEIKKEDERRMGIQMDIYLEGER